MPVERAAGGASLIDVLDRVLDKGIVIDAWVRVSLVGIDLITVEARVVVEDAGEEADQLAARVRLLEGFVGRAEIADSAQIALQWLGEVIGITQSICLVRLSGEASLFVVGAYGLAGSAAPSFSISLEDWNNPLVTALNDRKQIFFP